MHHGLGTTYSTSQFQMMSSQRFVQYTLPVLAAGAIYTVWGLAENNRTFEFMRIIRGGSQLIPGTSVPLKRVYTGIKPVDYQLTVLACFFWPVANGDLPGASLLARYFAFQFAVMYVIMLIEAVRPANRGKFFSM